MSQKRVTSLASEGAIRYDSAGIVEEEERRNMKSEEIGRALKKHRKELSGWHVESLALFGSAARNEAGPSSDLDFVVEFQGRATFDRYMGLKIFLEDLFHRRVDLVTRQGIRPQLRPLIEKEAIHVA